VEDRRFAVLGDPDGDRVIAAPDDHGEMARLQREAHQAELGFFCATAAGGCGDRLSAVNGRQRRPYFRHFPGAICGLRETAEVRDWFTHRMIQNALVAWLHDLGFPAAIEQRVGAHARVDVLSANAVIEVQLSGETEISRQERTTKYGENVTWLFDPHRNITSRDAQLEDEGVVLLVRMAPPPCWRWRPSTSASDAPTWTVSRRGLTSGRRSKSAASTLKPACSPQA
jgi:competence CoiA-like predicted nuclease